MVIFYETFQLEIIISVLNFNLKKSLDGEIILHALTVDQSDMLKQMFSIRTQKVIEIYVIYLGKKLISTFFG